MTRRPCIVCEAHGVKTMTSRLSSGTVAGGVRVACQPRPVCKSCDSEAGRYPVIAAPSVPEGEDPADWTLIPCFDGSGPDGYEPLRRFLNTPLPPERKRD